MTESDLACRLGLSEYAVRSIAAKLDAMELATEHGDPVTGMQFLAAFAEVTADDDLDALMLDAESCYEA